MKHPDGKLTPFIWLEHGAEEAANFYVSLFPSARILDVSRWADGSPYPAGSVMSAIVEIAGTQFMLFNGGPHFKLNESFSIFVNCEDQAEVDRYWDALIANGGTPSQCGWLKDKFGLSWQIIPRALGKALGHPDPVKAGKAMQAMMKMVKIDVAALERATA